ncbi:MAG: lipid-binding SYLF domain-containing protein [Candidatus Caenarcaniphilales bacterium]|nr:lipid-binding SYLF domain-containing protein [Candidatus Caenarcaniphilales bacterium]
MYQKFFKQETKVKNLQAGNENKKLLLFAAFMSFILLVLSLNSNQASFGATQEDTKVNNATIVLKQIMAIPESGIPIELLENAQGIAVIPGMLKLGFIIGGERGRGILSIKQANGQWSNPVFITSTAGSVGYQGGAQKSDLVLVFKSDRSVKNILNGKFTLGADAAIAAGPVGRSASAGVDSNLNAEVYSYSRSKGLFAGVSLEGAAIDIDAAANNRYYKKFQLTPQKIVDGKVVLPVSGRNFLTVLSKQAAKK